MAKRLKNKHFRIDWKISKTFDPFLIPNVYVNISDIRNTQTKRDQS
jgi:hypothetical protein